MDFPLNEDGTRHCLGCSGSGSMIGHLWNVEGAPWGVVTCPTCGGAGKLDEARYREFRAERDSFPTEAEVDERNKGEEWKWGEKREWWEQREK